MTDKAKKLLMLYEQSGKRKTLESVPPLTFKGYGKDLKNYRIYGNTVNGESVGDRTGNLFDEIYTGITTNMTTRFRTLVVPNGEYTLSTTMPMAEGGSSTNLFLCTTEDPTPYTPNNGVYAGHSKTVTVNDGRLFIFYRAPRTTTDPRNYKTMLNSGSTALPYEPYGYRVPVTVANGTDTETTNLYLPEQIKMVGDEAEYIDFREQKQHFVDGTSTDITLPALPTLSDTNILSVGTTVQPSKVEITGKIKQI